ncbi:MAG: hypothetical protein HC911_17930 [Chloroflexaceae bacterium]|nr:hypothetical protein [Chloroflexaceae bacterium]
MSDAHVIEVLEERWVEFYDDTILAMLVRMDEAVRVLAPVRPVCEVLGLDWSAQRRRINRDEVLRSVVAEITTTARDGKRYKMLALPLEYLHGWLFGIGATQVKEEYREKITLYRRECFRALSAAFQAELLLPDTSTTPPPPAAEQGMTLTQIADLGRAITQMAEQQLALQEQLGDTHTLATHAHARLDKAADVIKALQRRTATLEDKLHPHASITDEQAAHVAQLVKALAELLTEQGGKNHYQGIFGELYRRFGVSSYKLIRIEQYDAVLAFLEQWREAAMRGAGGRCQVSGFRGGQVSGVRGQVRGRQTTKNTKGTKPPSANWLPPTMPCGSGAPPMATSTALRVS